MAEDALALIKRAIPLPQYVGQFTKVTKMGSGSGYMAFCIFHDNTNTPALSITDMPAGGLWQCHGCGAGGSVIDFWMLQHGMDPKDHSGIREALEGLAKETGIALPELPAQERDGVSPSRIKRALDAVAEACCDALFDGGRADAAAALAYLEEERLASDAIIERYLLGFMPEENRAAVDLILRAADDRGAAIAGGLLNERAIDGALYTPYSGRLMVPIRDRSGRTIGFGGRTIPGIKSSPAKWINPSETPTYSKSAVLYNQDVLLKRRGAAAVVVEGYLDAIAITESEAEAVGVACCGTAFTTGHIELLSSVRDLAFVFDGDAAGAKALSSTYWVANRRKDATYVALDGGRDPWDLTFGGESHEPAPQIIVEELRAARPLLEGCVRARRNVEEQDGDFDRWVANAAANLHDSFARDRLLSSAAAIRGYALASYNRLLSDIKIRAVDEARVADESTPVIDVNAGLLATRLLQLTEIDRAALLATVERWDAAVEAMVREWFPGDRDLEVDVFNRILTGGGDLAADRQRFTDLTVAGILPAESADTADIGRPLRGMITLMAHDGRALTADPDTPRMITRQLLKLRELRAAAGEVEQQLAVLAALIDLGVDIQRHLERRARTVAAE